MQKVRLYRGPFDGKVIIDSVGFRDTFMHIGPKKMTRKQQNEWRMSEDYQRALFWQDIGMTRQGGKVRMAPSPVPLVRAEYRKKLVTTMANGSVFVDVVCMHPDGSIFYEWTGFSQPVGPGRP